MRRCQIYRGGSQCVGMAQQWPTIQPSEGPSKHSHNIAKRLADRLLLCLRLQLLPRVVQHLAQRWIQTWAVTWDLFPIGIAGSSVLLDVGRPCNWRLLVMMDRSKLINVGGAGAYATMSALPRWFAVCGHGAAMAHHPTH